MTVPVTDATEDFEYYEITFLTEGRRHSRAAPEMSMACLELQTPGSEQRDLSAGLQQPKFQPHSLSYRSEQDPELKL